MAYDLKLKKYYDGRIAYMISQNPIVGHSNVLEDKEKEKKYSDPEDDMRRSKNRTKDAIYDLAFNNRWEYFVTVTFDQEKVDRYNFAEVNKKYSKMLNNLKSRKCPDLEYLFVPELHKDGAIHFHGLILGADNLDLNDSGKTDRNNRKIYNSADFALGFNTFTRIGNPQKAATYITKYITKAVCYMIPGKKYWSSRGLDLPEVETFLIRDDEQKKILISDLLTHENFAGAHCAKIDTSTFQNEYTYILTHPGADGEENRRKYFEKHLV